MIYLDNAATTKTHPLVVKEMLPYFYNKYGNAYSIHSFGVEVRNKVEEARTNIANYLNCSPDEIYFTSGATESNNWVLSNFVDFPSVFEGIPRIITTKIEHDSILNVRKHLRPKCNFTYLNVNKNGIIDPGELVEALEYNKNFENSRCLVSIMTANNEIGSVQPIQTIGNICKEYGVKFHTDATQAMSTIRIDVEKCNIDFLSCSAHKFYGPKGVGILYAKEGELLPFLFGGEQENGLRAGTTNSPSIIGMSKAIDLLVENDGHNDRIKSIRDYFVTEVLKIPGCSLNGSLNNRVVGNANICFSGINGAESLLMLLDEDGIIASSGSACNSSSLDPSHVLKAIGMSDEDAKNSIRFSFGMYNSFSEVEQVVNSLKKNLSILRG